MKIRNSFISNSSSSSFVIKLKDLTKEQIDMILNHIEIGKILGIDGVYGYDEWNIDVTDETIYGSTIMDNYDMKEFFDKIGIDDKNVEWDD